MKEIILKSQPITATKVRKQYLKEIGLKIFGIGKAYQRLEEIHKRTKLKGGETQISAQIAILLAERRGEIIKLHRQDALEEIRKQQGLDVLREYFLSKIKQELSVKAGQEKLSREVQRIYGKNLEGKGLYESFPQLTLVDYAFLNLCQRIPETVLLYGSRFSVGEIKKVKTSKIAPSLIGFTPHCLIWTNEWQDVSQLQRGVIETDFYVYLEITEEASGLEYVKLRPKIDQIIKALAILTAKNRRIHEAVFINNESALLTSFGKVAKKALETVINRELSKSELANLIHTIEKLQKEERKPFEEIRSEVEERIYQSTIFDLALSLLPR